MKLSREPKKGPRAGFGAEATWQYFIISALSPFWISVKKLMSLLTEEDEELLHEADNIAVKIAEVLIQAFNDKEGREPNGEEL